MERENQVRSGAVVVALVVVGLAVVGCYAPPTPEEMAPARDHLVAFESVATPTSQRTPEQVQGEMNSIRSALDVVAKEDDHTRARRALAEARWRLGALRPYLVGSDETKARWTVLSNDLATLEAHVGGPVNQPPVRSSHEPSTDSRDQSIMQAIGAMP